jgi:tetratricopeptide (TPR) repeat protein
VKITDTKYFSNKRLRIISVLLAGFCFFLASGTASAQCWTSDLSEEEQLSVARETFADGLYSAASETAKCYLDEFKESTAREEVFFLRAEALRKGGDIQGSIKAYDELKNNFPQSKSYLDNAILQQGITLVLSRKYPLAIKTLNSLLQDYPTSKLRDEAYYWLGYVTSFRAELLRKKNKQQAQQQYKTSIQHFKNGDPTALTLKQQQERWYLIGRAWWFMDNISNTAEAWDQYLKHSKSIKPEQALNLKYQLASRFQQAKEYKQSESWFARIVTEHPDSKLAVTSSFWRAEMAYAESLKQTKTEVLDQKSVIRLVNLYKLYIDRKHKEYRALAYYRIGVLEQKHQPHETITAFKKYLSTKDKIYASEVQYRLAYLYIENKELKKAILILNQYLSTKDKTYADDAQYRLGYLYIETKQQKKAIETFEKYLAGSKAKHTVEIQIRLGYLYIETKELKKAIEIFKIYLAGGDAEHIAEIQIRVGYLYIETKQQKKAIESFKKYLASGDTEHVAEIQIRLGYLYLESKQQKKAIKIFEQYLASGAAEHSVAIQLRLAYLYVETKQNFLAISLMEQVRLHPDYRQNSELLQTLMVLYRDTVSKEKFVQFLLSVRSDAKLAEKVRHGFQTQLILTYYEQNKCEKVLAELKDKPGYLQNSKKTNPEVWQHLLFLKGSCLIETQKWEESRTVFRQIRETDKYREQAIQMLLEAHKQLEDWKSITWEFQDIFDRKSPAMTIPYFQLWVFAAQRRTDFQRLERLKIISERWKNAFPEDKHNLAQLNLYVSRARLQELTEQENWKEVSAHIRNELKSGKISLDEQYFSQLLFAEQKLENWVGVLSAYTLLGKHDPERAGKLDVLISQAKAAEKLGKKELALVFYRKALKAKPQTATERKKQDEISKFLAQGAFQKWIEQGEWSKVTKAIHQEVRAKKRILDEQNFELLLYAENKKSGNKKYIGILEAYSLLAIYNKKKVLTVEEQIEQAEAAEKLGRKELSLEFYRQALKIKPQTEMEKSRQDEISKFLAQSSFQKLIDQKEWSKVTRTIQREVKAKKRILDDKNFELLLFAENKKPGREKYNGILDAYALLAIYNKKKTLTVEAQIDQGFAAEKLGGYRRAKGYYRRALKKVPDKNVDLVLQLVGELTRLYERSKDYESLVRTYKRAYHVLKKSSRPKKEYQTYAYLIGYHQSSQLKQTKKARIWMLRADGGGSSTQELQAAFWVAQLDREANKTDKALKRLKELAGRKIPKNSSMYVQIHFEIGTLYHFKEKWKSALRHYRLVAQARAPSELKQFQKVAKQKAKEIDSYLKSIGASQ